MNLRHNSPARGTIATAFVHMIAVVALISAAVAAVLFSSPTVAVADESTDASAEIATDATEDSPHIGHEWGTRFQVRDGVVRTRIDFEMHAGERGRDAVDMINGGESELTLIVLPVDAAYDDEGRATVARQRASSEQWQTGQWISAPSVGIMNRSAAAAENRSESVVGMLVLAPHSEQSFEFEVAVPEDVAPGKYAVALSFTQQVESPDDGVERQTRGEVPVERTLIVYAHVTVLAQSDGSTAGEQPTSPALAWLASVDWWLVALIAAGGAVLLVAFVVVWKVAQWQAMRQPRE